MALLSLQDVSLRLGGELLFDGINLHIESGDTLCLLGRNGSGKSTLLKVISGEMVPDSGAVSRNKNLHLGYMPQDIPRGDWETARDAALIPSTQWHFQEEFPEVEVNRLLEQVHINPESPWARLSGGEKRRVLLVRALSHKPELIILDEPTNHLDIATIEWLENYLKRINSSLIFITHDRSFARRLANRVAEIDRGNLYAFSAGYDSFLQRREELAQSEVQQRAAFDKLLVQEEAWLRRGIKARRTRDEGRVKALKRMREEHKQRRNTQGLAKLGVQESIRSGDLVYEALDIEFAYPSNSDPLIQDFSATILRGDRIGIVGPNGAGKTTLVKLLVGQLLPNKGMVKQGQKLQLIYLDQLRAQLDMEKTIQENISGEDDMLIINGKAKHINAYLQDFLFDPDRARSPVKILSGGEKNRLLLAKLLSQPGNVMILDEPTNDLDIETLELLEDMLHGFQGTLLLVSHDREFLDNVVTDCFILGEKGLVHQHVGSYTEWREIQSSRPDKNNKNDKKPIKTSSVETNNRTRSDKLNFREQQELDELPQIIAGLEEKIKDLHDIMADPQTYKKPGEWVKNITETLEITEAELKNSYQRWEVLEERSSRKNH